MSNIAKIPRGWTVEAHAWLLEQGRNGVGASEIVKPLAELYNITKTRNAITGMFHRAGISTRYHRTGNIQSEAAREALRRRRLQRRVENKPKAAAPPPPVVTSVATDIAIPAGKRRPMAKLEHAHCRWPIGEPGHKDFGYCPHNAVPNRPYCEAHARRAFQEPAAKRTPSALPRAKPERVPTFDDHLREVV